MEGSIGIDYRKVMYVGLGDDRSLSSGGNLAENLKRHRHYYVHMGDGAEVVNPESIRKDQLLAGLKRAWTDEFYEPHQIADKGPPSFSFISGDGKLVFAVNHPRTTSGKKNCELGSSSSGVVMSQNVIYLDSHIIATISGELDVSEKLLEDLKEKYIIYKKKGGRISVLEASKLMIDILSSRSEVGLIAGWNQESGVAELYRADGMGVLIKGNRFASGSGFDFVYLDLMEYGGYRSWPSRTVEKLIIYIAYRTRKGQAKSPFGIPDYNKGENYVTVYHVGPDGWKNVSGEMNVKECLSDCQFHVSCLDGELEFVDKDDEWEG